MTRPREDSIAVRQSRRAGRPSSWPSTTSSSDVTTQVVAPTSPELGSVFNLQTDGEVVLLYSWSVFTRRSTSDLEVGHQLRRAIHVFCPGQPAQPSAAPGKTEDPREKLADQRASSGTIPTCENPVTRPGIEPGERANRTETRQCSSDAATDIVINGARKQGQLQHSLEAAVAERLARSPPTLANRVQSPAGSLPDFRKDDAAGRRVFSGVSRFLIPSFRRCSIRTSLHPHRLSRS
ncbi:hypothetical protein PR048_030555 [Dryococelus australis]|uniref:Uncharacterized protein n=1 Tax=Dryococelus australis TaxID=614101 RepID=A0ABQ9GD56_9NEOP|nr:hypothetical protein PR048_030555 [Dryococelus australis]